MASRRIRIVSLPPSDYLLWELFPDIYTMDTTVMCQAVYDGNGVLDHALRYTDEELVRRCQTGRPQPRPM